MNKIARILNKLRGFVLSVNFENNIIVILNAITHRGLQTAIKLTHWLMEILTK